MIKVLGEETKVKVNIRKIETVDVATEETIRIKLWEENRIYKPIYIYICMTVLHPIKPLTTLFELLMKYYYIWARNVPHDHIYVQPY